VMVTNEVEERLDKVFQESAGLGNRAFRSLASKLNEWRKDLGEEFYNKLEELRKLRNQHAHPESKGDKHGFTDDQVGRPEQVMSDWDPSIRCIRAKPWIIFPVLSILGCEGHSHRQTGSWFGLREERVKICDCLGPWFHTSSATLLTIS